jgi:hypothetical protein
MLYQDFLVFICFHLKAFARKFMEVNVFFWLCTYINKVGIINQTSVFGIFQVLFLSERVVVGVGYDCNPMLFIADNRGTW